MQGYNKAERWLDIARQVCEINVSQYEINLLERDSDSLLHRLVQESEQYFVLASSYQPTSTQLASITAAGTRYNSIIAKRIKRLTFASTASPSSAVPCRSTQDRRRRSSSREASASQASCSCPEPYKQPSQVKSSQVKSGQINLIQFKSSQ